MMTTRMWAIKQRITFLSWVVKCHPKDREARSEIKKLVSKYEKLARREQLGLRLVKPTQASNPCTGSAA